VLREITLDAALLDHRVGAGHGPAPPIRRKAAPKQQRQHSAKRPGDHQDDPTVLILNPEVVTSSAKVKMAPTTNRKILTQGST